MLVVVVTLFAVCWLPLHAFMMVIDFNPELVNYKTVAQQRFFVGLYYCVHWLAMSNSFVNPIIYGFLNDCFRVNIAHLLSARVDTLAHTGLFLPGAMSLKNGSLIDILFYL